jgi:predicted outer membrane protein
MRRYLLGLLKGALIVSTSLAAAQDVGPHIRPSPDPEGGTGMGGMERPAHPVSNAEVVATVAAFERGEVALGHYAVAHARNFEVREYGRSMESAYSNSDGRMTELARSLTITPARGVLSRRVASEAAATQRRLAHLGADAFDRAYLDAEITACTQMLERLDRTLIPSADRSDLRTALQLEVRPMVAANLTRARNLRERL